MKRILSKLLILVSISFINFFAHSGSPLWTFTPIGLTTLTLDSDGTAVVSYQVTNQASRTYTLAMQPIAGVSQVTTSGNCPNPFVLQSHQSCNLNLLINGSTAPGFISGGPIVCNNGNLNQCYQPEAADRLYVNVTQVPVNLYTVGGSVSGLVGTLVLQNNGSDDLTLNSDGSFTFSNPIPSGGTYAVTVRNQPTNQACTVANGSGTINGSDITNVSVNCVTNSTTLSLSTTSLALSVTGLTEYGVTGTPNSGYPRVINVTNTGTINAENLSITYPTWPSGTSSQTTCGTSLAPSSSCSITITPGSTASSDGTSPCSSGTAPIPGTIQVSSDSAASVSASVVILDYGCIYQEGYVYSFDDSTANTSSVGGKVVSLINAVPNGKGVVWSSSGPNGVGTYWTIPQTNDIASYDTIPGIDQSSTTSVGSPSYSDFSSFFATTYTNVNPFTSSSFATCNGTTDGSCNTNNIYTFYNQFITNYIYLGSMPFTASPGPTQLDYYAAGFCKLQTSGYSDWYLPAICEMGYATGGLSASCGTSSTPTLQNIQSSLIEQRGFTEPSGNYWSSTEQSPYSQYNSYIQYFSFSSPMQSYSQKDTYFLVRCSRAFT